MLLDWRLWRARHALVLTWTLALVIGEAGVFWAASYRCASVDGRREPISATSRDAINVAVVADPQLTDAFSYGQRPGSLTLWLTEFYSDLYMRRAYRLAVRAHAPSKVVFVGDLFDGGRVANEASYARHVERFKAIFGADWSTFIFAAGNHDVGLGRYFAASAADQFRKFFGPRSHETSVCGKRLVVLDGPSLVNGRYGVQADQFAMSEASAVVNAMQDRSKGVLLFTHIPLWRAPGVSCGPEARRFKTNLAQGAGISYQNLLDRETSSLLLEKLGPELIVSGDDHDNCIVSHTTSVGVTREYTVATFSWLQGVRRPGFAIVRLEGCKEPLSGIQKEARMQVCGLPDQLAVYLGYILLACASIIFLAARRGVQLRFLQRGSQHRIESDASARVAASDLKQAPDMVRASADATPATILRKRTSQLPLFVIVEEGSERGGEDLRASAATSALSYNEWIGLARDVAYIVGWSLLVYFLLLLMI
ncbi:Metallophosphoesterase 1 [Hondaea fermentalgiana]|uniref:Metallophosphoesterase 1 n=1 Tax=Hondaea fermentalgiana TaxID=2315210 RepID=A0A2R5GHS3_9STRA|nr:Metallophosphoesterase 1 [Hondaea fermentalgiana]|eukprot:GBG29889.1 Metallophosphoesterase 1 [Hondaea fermentalgiana]